MAEDAVTLGRRVARRFIIEDDKPTPSRLATELNVEIIRVGSPPPAQRGLRSEYRADPPQIILYCNPINQLSASIQANQRSGRICYDLVEVHIAHELFHHLEFTAGFGPLPRAEAEVAAHAFTQELMGLDFIPQNAME